MILEVGKVQSAASQRKRRKWKSTILGLLGHDLLHQWFISHHFHAYMPTSLGVIVSDTVPFVLPGNIPNPAQSVFSKSFRDPTAFNIRSGHNIY